MADYFDRLLARHAPVARGAAAGARPGDGGTGGGGSGGETGGETGGPVRPVRVRPRPAGPFERVEALRERSDTDDGLSAAVAPVPAERPARTGEIGGPRTVREIRTERHTVVRDASTGPPEAGEPVRHRQRPESARLRPVPRSPRPVAGTPAQPAAEVEAGGARRGGSGAPVPGTAPALVARSGEVTARPAAARQGGDGLSPGRNARRQAASARRGGTRPPERVVHVQIGRLEVTAATPPGAGGGGPGEAGRQRTGRAAPTVSLDDYLARGRNGERSN